MATNEPAAAGYTSRLYTTQNLEVPSARLNPGDDTVPPFATVQLSKGSYMTIYTPDEARALAAAFWAAAAMLEKHAASGPEDDPADPPPFSRDLSGDLSALTSDQIPEDGTP